MPNALPFHRVADVCDSALAYVAGPADRATLRLVNATFHGAVATAARAEYEREAPTFHRAFDTRFCFTDAAAHERGLAPLEGEACEAQENDTHTAVVVVCPQRRRRLAPALAAMAFAGPEAMRHTTRLVLAFPDATSEDYFAEKSSNYRLLHSLLRDGRLSGLRARLPALRHVAVLGHGDCARELVTDLAGSSVARELHSLTVSTFDVLRDGDDLELDANDGAAAAEGPNANKFRGSRGRSLPAAWAALAKFTALRSLAIAAPGSGLAQAVQTRALATAFPSLEVLRVLIEAEFDNFRIDDDGARAKDAQAAATRCGTALADWVAKSTAIRSLEVGFFAGDSRVTGPAAAAVVQALRVHCEKDNAPLCSRLQRVVVNVEEIESLGTDDIEYSDDGEEVTEDSDGGDGSDGDTGAATRRPDAGLGAYRDAFLSLLKSVPGLCQCDVLPRDGFLFASKFAVDLLPAPHNALQVARLAEDAAWPLNAGNLRSVLARLPRLTRLQLRVAATIPGAAEMAAIAESLPHLQHLQIECQDVPAPAAKQAAALTCLSGLTEAAGGSVARQLRSLAVTPLPSGADGAALATALPALLAAFPVLEEPGTGWLALLSEHHASAVPALRALPADAAPLRHARKLNFAGSGSDAASLSVLQELRVGSVPKLTELDFSVGRELINNDGAFADALRPLRNPSVTSLMIRGGALTLPCLEALAEAFPSVTSLVFLKKTGNDVTPEFMAQRLAKLPCLWHIRAQFAYVPPSDDDERALRRPKYRGCARNPALDPLVLHRRLVTEAVDRMAHPHVQLNPSAYVM